MSYTFTKIGTVGTEVVANNGEETTEELATLKVGDTNYSLGGGKLYKHVIKTEGSGIDGYCNGMVLYFEFYSKSSVQLTDDIFTIISKYNITHVYAEYDDQDSGGSNYKRGILGLNNPLSVNEDGYKYTSIYGVMSDYGVMECYSPDIYWTEQYPDEIGAILNYKVTEAL